MYFVYYNYSKAAPECQAKACRLHIYLYFPAGRFEEITEITSTTAPIITTTTTTTRARPLPPPDAILYPRLTERTVEPTENVRLDTSGPLPTDLLQADIDPTLAFISE